MESIKEIVQKHKIHTLIPIVTILSIVAILSFSIDYPIVKISTVEKSNYLIPGVLAIVALIASFTFFYSGKMNDCKRDYVQRIADLEEMVDKTKRWLNGIEDKNTHVDNCKHFIEQSYQYLQDPNTRISFTSTEVSILSIVAIGLIFASLGMVNSPSLDLFDLLYAAVVFITGIIYFFKLWFMYEQILKVYNNDLITLNRFIGTLKGIYD